MSETIAMADNETRAMSMEEKNRLPLREDVIVDGKKEKYEIKAGDRIGSGGESQVYLAKRQSDGEQVVIKVYDTFPDNLEYKNNRKKLLSFLYENNDYKNNHIMPLFDDGFINLLSIDEEHYTKPFDVIPYCKDGEIKKGNYEELKNKIIPDIIKALKVLHEKGLVHRDIKPCNIYIYNNVVLLADFGTTSSIINIESHGKTQTRRGTPGYTAPELSENYYVPASDYFSLGCTIATLYNGGKHVYQDFLNAKDFENVIISMRRNGIPLECPHEEESLQILVDALVMRDENMRAGYDAVKLWLDNPGSFVSSWRNKIQQGLEKTSFNFIFEGIKCTTYEELTDAMSANWEKGKQYLYRKTVINALDDYNQTLSNQAHDIIECEETALNQDLGFAKFLHYLNTTEESYCPIYWCGEKYNYPANISAAISAGKADKAKIIEMLKSKFLSWKYENTKDGVTQETIDSFKEIERVASIYPELGYNVLMYKTDPERARKLETADEIFKNITKNDSDFYLEADALFKNDKLLANLLCVGGTDSVLDFIRSLTGKLMSDDGNSDLTRLYMLFELFCKDKTRVREHYLRFAPQAYLYWFQQNISLYSFNSSRTKEFANKIKSVNITGEMDINEISRGFSLLGTYFKEFNFYQLFQNNYFLTYMGFNTDNDLTGITTINTHAFFAANFFGVNVPVGYFHSIGQRG